MPRIRKKKEKEYEDYLETEDNNYMIVIGNGKKEEYYQR